jgi:peptidoglycan/xylan/chitin deacetylase (PgdA/CDA1 family)
MIGFVLAAAGSSSAVHAADCAYDPKTSNLSRIIAVDSTGGPVFGRILTGKGDKARYKSLELRDKEVILSFDDGPLPPYTTTILDALDRHCVKATFFSVGKMALAFPKVLKEIERRGHTIGTHTWSHPRGMDTMDIEDVKYEIEKGFIAVSEALGKPIAPFVRIPGLRDTPQTVDYLATRNISTWSVDVVAGDTEPGATPEKIASNTMVRLRKHGKGIILFHDIKKATAESIDTVLYALNAEGYKVVHVVSNTSYQPDPQLMASLSKKDSRTHQVSFTGKAIEGLKEDLRDGHVDYMHTEWVDLKQASEEADGDNETQAVAELQPAKPERRPASATGRTNLR